MNPQEHGLLQMTTALRSQMMDTLTDGDLAFSFPGSPALGELCREMGDVERSYIDSFTSLRQVWDERNTTPGLESSVEALKTWYQALDQELDTVLTSIPAEDFWSKTIDRGGGFEPTLGAQFHTYREAILIFCAKCSVYLRALGKPFSEQWVHWIG